MKKFSFLNSIDYMQYKLVLFPLKFPIRYCKNVIDYDLLLLKWIQFERDQYYLQHYGIFCYYVNNVIIHLVNHMAAGQCIK